MMMSGEESLKMLINKPSKELIEFIKANLDDEDNILKQIPRYEIPRADFENQVLREMRIVLKECIPKLMEMQTEEIITWQEFVKFYSSIENFDYPHKDKLLDFIKYYFLDHVVSTDSIMINLQAFKDHLLNLKSKSPSRNGSNIRSGRRESVGSDMSETASVEEALRKKLMATAGSDDDKLDNEEKMLDIAEQCFMRIADLMHMLQKTVRQVFLKYSVPEQFKDGSVLELVSPRGFLEGIRDIGFDDVTELEAACLMKVLAKPELDN